MPKEPLNLDFEMSTISETSTEEPTFCDVPDVLPELPWLSLSSQSSDVELTRWEEQAAGAVLGAAIGDAMGHPTEFMSMTEIHQRYGLRGVQNFELYRENNGLRYAPYTDDTQMAEIVLRSLLWSLHNKAGLDPTMKTMAEGFVHWAAHPQGGHRAPGNACLSGCQALASGIPWQQAGGAQAGGCGSVMRAYPFGLVFSKDIEKAEFWAVEHSRLTHQDPIAFAACAAMARGMGKLVEGETLDHVLSDMTEAAGRYSPQTAHMMTRAITEAQDGIPPSITLDRLRAWAAHEAIAASVYILARHPDDPVAAILEGANTPGDSDSIATLAGAFVGGRTGVKSLPKDWVADVERSNSLLELARHVPRGAHTF